MLIQDTEKDIFIKTRKGNHGVTPFHRLYSVMVIYLSVLQYPFLFIVISPA